MELTKENIADSFMKGVDCSQIIMGEWADGLGLSKEDALKVSSAFGGGLGVGESCGAIIGAMLVLGMKYGNSAANQQLQKDVLNAKRAEFLDKFKKAHTHFACRDLIGYDFSKPEDVPKILDSGILFEACPCFIRTACDILREIVE